MNVVAFDLSLTCCGWAGSDGDVGTFSSKHRGPARLHDLWDKVFTIAGGADVVLLEGYAFGARGRAVFSIGELGGVVRCNLWSFNYPVVEIPPSNLKKFATGKGNAPKDLVLVEAVRRLDYEGASNDEADALWMLNMARVHYGLPGAPDLPKTHLKALEKIEWWTP